jgi:hypothetical protein
MIIDAYYCCIRLVSYVEYLYKKYFVDFSYIESDILINKQKGQFELSFE